jgi:RNA polymerase sigma-70 factor (ECF subfamily)
MLPLGHRSPASDEQELIARVRQGDTSAFEVLFRRHFEAVFRFASSFVVDRDVADDVAQEVFGWVWVHRAAWNPPGDILSYLLAAVRNRALVLTRNEKRRANVTGRYVVPGESPAMAAPGLSMETVIEDEELIATIWRVIQVLPEPRRTVLLLRWRHGLEWDEVARIMEMSIPATRMVHSRALKLLRERLLNA